MASLDRSSTITAADRPPATVEKQGVAATVLGIVALVAIGVVIIVAVVRRPPNTLEVIYTYMGSGCRINPGAQSTTFKNCT